MTSGRGPVRYITLADDDQRPLGVVAYGGAGWTLNCGQCPHATPTTSPDTGVVALLAHIERTHSAGPSVESSRSSMRELTPGGHDKGRGTPQCGGSSVPPSAHVVPFQ